MNFSFHPKLLDAFANYSRAHFVSDVAAGVTVAVVALPLAIAFAMASGLTPLAGLTTAIIGGFLIAALGGSRVQIGGPAGAFIVIIYGIVVQYGLVNLLIATSMAGVLLFCIGLLRMGHLIRFIPIAIVTGFTNGIAVLIAFSQLRDFFGLDIAHLPADFFHSLQMLYQQRDTLHGPTLVVGLFSLAIVVAWPKPYLSQKKTWRRYVAHVPGTLIALVVATLCVTWGGWEVATIGTRFGALPQGLPHFAWPEFSWSNVKNLLPPAITIALLGAIESLLCARVADGLIHDRHDPNQELMAQGIANFVVPFFGGLAVTGTIARTMTNVRSGAVSPIAGMVHALTLLLILWVAAPLASYVPLAALAAILLFVAYNMGEWHAFPRLKQFSLQHRIVLLSTFFLTVIFDLTVAVEVGLALAGLFFIYRIADLTRLDKIVLPVNVPSSISAYRLYGSLFFGAVGKLEVLLDPQHTLPQVLILEAHQLISLDTTGLEVLQLLHQRLHRRRGCLVLCGLNAQPRSLLQRSGFMDKLGAAHCVDDLDQALAGAQQWIAQVGKISPSSSGEQGVAHA